MAELILQQLQQHTQFKDVIAYIEELYTHTPTAFKNGLQNNTAHENQGSAKVLYFAQLQQLDQTQTLNLFAEHYQSVLNTPDDQDHQNIRQFMQHGWSGVVFSGAVLAPKV
ncbi:HopJ type III effector protein [Acinetobacter boissieri]|uniref:HopJ type III effector protein n=1 Tax=Acinetobacter boissieri TaxID=1219383 RepID=A0A1G6GGE2_9GAMM|nr:HopJ type III effector protein [Acinetobacter boissieri]SDB81092.1 HopJ type III effector protein [Acinetobacter boissieri]